MGSGWGSFVVWRRGSGENSTAVRGCGGSGGIIFMLRFDRLRRFATTADKDVAAALPDTIETCVWDTEARQARCF